MSVPGFVSERELMKSIFITIHLESGGAIVCTSLNVCKFLLFCFLTYRADFDTFRNILSMSLLIVHAALSVSNASFAQVSGRVYFITIVKNFIS